MVCLSSGLCERSILNWLVLERDLGPLFIVSRAVVIDSREEMDPVLPGLLLEQSGRVSMENGQSEPASFEVLLSKAADHKCPRCWVYASKAELSPCHRCQQAMLGELKANVQRM